MNAATAGSDTGSNSGVNSWTGPHPAGNLSSGPASATASGATATPGGRDDLAVSYARHSGGLRGAVRHALVARALSEHLPAGGQRVLDVGGGSGQQAIGLARAGHEVVVLDPDEAMLTQAQAALLREPDDVAGRVQLVIGRGEDAASLLNTRGPAVGFDVVCCHGVLMYVPDPQPLISALVAVTRPGGMLSLLTKNAATMAMRPGLEGRWADALDQLNAPTAEAGTETGRLGVPSRGDTLNTLTALLATAGASVPAWYGVRLFTDHLRDAPVGADFDLICELEWKAGARDPYRQAARLLHVIAERDPSAADPAAGPSHPGGPGLATGTAVTVPSSRATGAGAQ